MYLFFFFFYFSPSFSKPRYSLCYPKDAAALLAFEVMEKKKAEMALGNRESVILNDWVRSHKYWNTYIIIIHIRIQLHIQFKKLFVTVFTSLFLHFNSSLTLSLLCTYIMWDLYYHNLAFQFLSNSISSMYIHNVRSILS